MRVSAGSEHWTQFYWQLRLWLICGLPLAWALARDLASDGDDWEATRLGFLSGFGLGPGLAGAFSPDQWLAFFPPFLGLWMVSTVLAWPRRSFTLALRSLCLFNALAFLNGIFDLAPAWGTLALMAVLSWGLSPAGIRGGAYGLVLAAFGVVVRFQIAWEGWRAMLLLGVLMVAGWIFAMLNEANVAAKN
jgi:hypothetical protein